MTDAPRDREPWRIGVIRDQHGVPRSWMVIARDTVQYRCCSPLTQDEAVAVCGALNTLASATGGEPHGLPGEPTDEQVIVAVMCGFEKVGIEPGETWRMTYELVEKIGAAAGETLRAAYAVDRASGAATHGDNTAAGRTPKPQPPIPSGGQPDDAASGQAEASPPSVAGAAPAATHGEREAEPLREAKLRGALDELLRCYADEPDPRIRVAAIARARTALSASPALANPMPRDEDARREYERIKALGSPEGPDLLGLLKKSRGAVKAIAAIDRLGGGTKLQASAEYWERLDDEIGGALGDHRPAPDADPGRSP